MMQVFKPDLSILPEAQKKLWPKLNHTPEHFVLYGGTALALRLGHRVSVDFDFFSRKPFDPQRLYSSITYLKGQQALNTSENTLDVRVETNDGSVKVSFFGGLDIQQIETPDIAPDNGIAIASLRDIFGMKCATVFARAEIKDYQDIHALLTIGNLPLSEGLAAATAIYGQQYNPITTLKALSYFGDLPGKLTGRQEQELLNAVKSVDLSRLPNIEPGGHIGSGIDCRKVKPGEPT